MLKQKLLDNQVKLSTHYHLNCELVSEQALFVMQKDKMLIELGIMFDGNNNGYRVYFDLKTDKNFAVLIEEV